MHIEENKNIENLIDKLMLDDELTSTSTHFTDTIMGQVEQLNQHKAFDYKPLISNKTWLLICALTVGVLIYIIHYGNLTESKWMNYLEIDLNLKFLSELKYSNTTLYATIIVSLLFLVQFILLKNYFNKRLSI